MDEWTSCKFYLSLTAWRETRGDGERNDKGILNGRNVSLRSASIVTDAWDALSNKWNWNKETWNRGLAKNETVKQTQVSTSLLDKLHKILSHFLVFHVEDSKETKMLCDLNKCFITDFEPFRSALLMVFWLYSKASDYVNCLKTTATKNRLTVHLEDKKLDLIHQ